MLNNSRMLKQLNHHYIHAERNFLNNMPYDLLLIHQILLMKFHSHQNINLRVSRLLEYANVKPHNIEIHFTPNIPAWCLNIPDFFYLHSGKTIIES